MLIINQEKRRYYDVNELDLDNLEIILLFLIHGEDFEILC
jgi:hypothetical protein